MQLTQAARYFVAARCAAGGDAEKTKHFGPPKKNRKSGIASFYETAIGSGFVRFSIHFATGTATGHIALFSNGKFHEGAAEDDYLKGDPEHPEHYVVRSMQYWGMK